MIDYNIEFTKGVLFIRLFGTLSKLNCNDIEFDLVEVIKDGGIKYLVFNIEDLKIDGDVSLFHDCCEIVKENGGRMLLCTNKDNYIDDFELIDDELSAFKVFSVC